MSKLTRDFPSDQLRVRYNLDSKKLDPPPPPPYDPVYDADPKRWGYFEPIGGPGNNATTLDFDWGCSEYNIVIDEPAQEPRVAQGNDIRHHRVFLLNDDYNRPKGIQFLFPGEDIEDEPSMEVEDGFRVTLGTHDFILRHAYRSRPRPEGAFEKYVQVGNESTSGSFGTVITVTDRKTPGAKLYALKIIRLGTTPKFEVSAMCTLKHHNVCRMEEYFLCSNSTMHILLEHAPDGDLSGYLSCPKAFVLNENLTEWETVAAIMSQLCTAVAYIHVEGIMHRDIKPDNVLVFLTNSELGFSIKLADFGLAYLTHPKADPEHRRRICGHQEYMAPEMADGKDYGDAVDVYSAGVIFYQIIRLICQGKTGASDIVSTSSENGESAMAYLLSEREPSRLWSPPEDFRTVVEKARELVEGMLKEEPAERLSMVEALKNAWLEEMVERVATLVEDGFIISDNRNDDERVETSENENSLQIPIVHQGCDAPVSKKRGKVDSSDSQKLESERRRSLRRQELHVRLLERHAEDE